MDRAARACGRRGYATPVKTRILAGGIHSAKQQVVRIDRGVGAADRPRPTRAAFERARAGAPRAAPTRCSCRTTASGLVTPALVRGASARALAAGRRVPVLVDSRYGLLRYRGMTACTPNESEVEQPLGVRIGDDAARARARRPRAARRARGAEAVLITRGSRGMALFERGRPTMHIPIFGSDEIADVTGAGDTVIATLTLALAAGASFEEAARLANYAGGLVVMKRGTATVSAPRAARRGRRAAPTAVADDGTTSSRATSWSRRVAADRARAAGRSPSPTAASTCCTSATSATCRRAAREADRARRRGQRRCVGARR